MDADAIVVGSGASATSAAFPLAESGLRVLMLDVGHVDAHYAPLLPDLPFSELRRRDRGQHRYFLGDRFEGIPFGDVRVGAQLTPPRQFVQSQTEELTPLATETFSRFESLALGGLAAGWGAIAVELDDHDLRDFPIGALDLAPHYERVSARVGISGARDDLLPWYGERSILQPPLELDSNGQAILERYDRRKAHLNRRRVYLGRPRLAVLSEPMGNRRGQQYHDMDFYADADRSVFRPAFAVEDLRRFAGFRYVGGHLVERFLETSEGVEVEAIQTTGGASASFSARRLVLAAGAMGTARIVLRSFDRYDVPVFLVSNPYTYAPCVNLAMLGRAARDRRHSLTQVGIIYDPPGGPLVHAQIYSYRSLLLFKVVKEAPLGVRESTRILRELLDSLVIVGIHHEDRPSPGKRCVLRRAPPGSREALEVHYEPEREEVRRQDRAERRILRSLRRVSCLPIRRIRPGHGASIHYGGTIPMTAEERELTVDPACRLRGTRHVYLADGSCLPYLPAKALTLTLMANADRVGRMLAENLSPTGSVRPSR